MPRCLTLLILLLWALSTAPTVAADERLPRPAGLEPNVRFWARIYAEVDGGGGLIHDSRHLDVVYERFRFGDGWSSRTRERKVEARKKEIRAVLRSLARGKRTGLSAEEARILALWPAGVSNKTLRSAADHVRFQLGQADKFRAGIIRSGAWRDHIDRVLEARGVPAELDALPHVESSYNPKAYSRVGAAGLWQFTRSTGKRYLRVDHVVDERMDPYRATEAAAHLLSDNYRRLKSWPLAITAYNHGVTGMARAMRKLGTDDIATISRQYKSRTFGFASRNFYAEFLAALQVDRNRERYFGVLPSDPPVSYEEVSLDHYYPAVSLARVFSVDVATLRQHNPALRPSVWNGAKYAPRGFTLKLPTSRVGRPLELALADVPTAQRFSRQHRDKYYKVRRGDTLSTIARRYRVGVSQLVSLNNLRSRHRIRVGQVLILPDDATGGGVQVTRQPPPADGRYRVRRGDTLSIISRRFGVPQRELAELNGLRNRNVLHVGQTLRLPGAEPPATVQVAQKPAAKAPTPAPAPVEPAKPVAPPAPAPTARVAELPKPAAAPSVQVAKAETATSDAAQPALPVVEPTGPVEIADTDAPPVAEPDAEPTPGPSGPDPSSYAVTAQSRIVVQAEETLGHYADWLEVRASDLRRLNGLAYGTPVVIGRRLKLDFRRVTPETFEQRRLAYHQTLQEEFFDSYTVTGTSTHVLRRGETLWYLANRKFRVPVWLLRQYNPDLDFGALPAGAQMVIPEIEPRTS